METKKGEKGFGIVNRGPPLQSNTTVVVYYINFAAALFSFPYFLLLTII